MQSYETQTKALFQTLSAKTLTIDDISPSTVFKSYAESSGLFAEGKKNQFPDAFIFECLKQQASETSSVIIVSKDSDFKHPAESQKYILVLDSLPSLFQQLGLEQTAPDLDDFWESHLEQLLKVVDSELDDWGLQVSDVEDAEIEETEVTNIEMGELISFGSSKDNGPILVVGKLEVTALASFTHPDWDSAVYDSEDKVLIPLHDVSGETEVIFVADFSMSIGVNQNREPVDIQSFRFRNDDFVWVDLNPITYD